MTKAQLTIVTATAGQAKAEECFQSWYDHASVDRGVVVIMQGAIPNMPLRAADRYVEYQQDEYLGPVPAFKLGVDLALQITAPDGLIACLHDDLLIEEDGWDQTVLDYFAAHPEVGLAGFGGGTGLGSDDIYQAPYDPMQLARQGFVSNMRDAEAHGRRSTVPVKVACLDGFSQIGRAQYWQGIYRDGRMEVSVPPFAVLNYEKVTHHCYDSFLGGWAARLGWEVAMIPIACTHFGGQTAVGDSAYGEWAKTQHPEGDAGFWQHAHRRCYERLRGVLPIRV